MAKKKKSRVPTPPRTSQGPQKRAEGPKRRVESDGPRRLNLWFVALGAAIIVAVASVGIALAFRGNDTVANGADGACVRQTFPPQGSQHVEKLANSFEYSTSPPTSGPHYPVPAIWNLYTEPVPEIRLVHNLEHGGLIVQYGDEVPAAQVQQITSWYQSDPEGGNGLIVTPSPELGDEIALTAWTHLMKCSRFDEGAFNRFRDDYRGPSGDAPEKFPLSALPPGT
ncbi:MAG: DUF3105 domain-containing protein [Gaiellaceae bacterium]